MELKRLVQLKTRPSSPEVIHSTQAGAACLPRDKTWVLVVAVFGSTVAYIDESVVNVALPNIELDLHTALASMQWVINAYTLSMSALLLIGGAAADRFGRRKLFIMGLITFTLASIACGLALEISALIVARVIQGAGAALLIPCSLAIIGAAFDKGERDAGVGIWSSATALAAGAGPLLAGLLIDHLSWRAIFFINPVIAIPTLAIALRRLPESSDPAARASLDWLGALFVLGGFGSVIFGLIASSALGWRNLTVEGSLLAGVLLLLGFVLQEGRSNAPMVPLTLFRSRRFRGINLLTLLLYGALGGAFFFLPFLLIQQHGFSAVAAGGAYLPFALVVAFLSRWSGSLVERFGARWPLIVGSIVVAVGFALLALISHEQYYWVYLVPMTILGFGMAMTVTPLTVTVINSVQTRATGVASGINDVSAAVASLLAVGLLGTLVGSSPAATARLVMASAAILSLASAAVAALTIE
jgi:EmrB/QacA subfamily drug resistance transporter